MDSTVPSTPIVFLKPPSALIETGQTVFLPSQSCDVHHEVELVVRVGKTGKSIREDEAMRFVDGYAVGLDLTARDLQALAKSKGQPWSTSKGFDTFAPVGPFRPAQEIPDPHALEISLSINGTVRQSGSTSSMIFRIPALIEYLSGIFTLVRGDLIFTGTPEGVGRIHPEDELTASISGLTDLNVRVSSGG